MSDEPSLLAAIRKHPDEDTPRLAYADWLDENAGSVPCGRCFEFGGRRVIHNPHPRRHSSAIVICPTCAGAGCVSDDRRERAEFIRVQCELARTPEPESLAVGVIGTAEQIAHATCSMCRNLATDRWCAFHALKSRERELLRDHGPRWFEETVAPIFIPSGCDNGPQPQSYIVLHGLHAVQREPFRRGFIENWTFQAADWLANGDAVRAAHPVRRVTLTTLPGLDLHLSGFTLAEGGVSRRYAARASDRIPGSIGAALSLVWPDIRFELPP